MPKYHFCLGFFYVLIFTLLNFSCRYRKDDSAIIEQDISKLFSEILLYDSIRTGIGLHGFNLLDSGANKFPYYFNSLTTANAMKFEKIHPHADEFDWKEGDSLVSYAEDNNMAVRGHTLLWSNRNPYWLFWDEKGNLVHRKQLESRLREHIHQVVSRYKGKVYAWDVVNEAVYDNDKEFLKTNTWYKIMGPDYIRKAFLFAHEVDSSALLFYNDYEAEEPGKLSRIVKLIQWLQSTNVPIHGMGIQGHWTLDKPSVQDIDKAINVYADLGLQVQITELDIRMPADFKGSETERLKILASRYAEIFEVLHKNRNKISGITFWQTEDIPLKFPPLFDANMNQTEIYQAILNAWSAN